jgi:ubiquinone/menaquinone biosynthesis C-methylase UbiE
MNATDSVKQCCARAYESDFAKILLGESFHPGGVWLTERLGVLLGLTPESLVLDVASGNGTSAFYIVERFGCRIVGIDYSARNVDAANAAAHNKGVAARVRFEQADAERLPVEDGSFDALVCECAFCTFPDKASAAREFARVLRPGGSVGLSDLTRGPSLPEDLNGILAWVACIADAQPVESYASYLSIAGLRVDRIEQHDEALSEMVGQVRTRLLGAEIAVGLKKIELPGVDFAGAKRMAQSALNAVRAGSLGYAVLHATKS